jgi:hypothetical protein
MTPIANCPVPFRFECPKLWENLQPTDNPDTRFCETCRKNVHLCHDMAEVSRRAFAGDCIAVQSINPRSNMVVGEPEPTFRYDRPGETPGESDESE